VNLPLYVDYHATTPTDPRVVEAMTPYFSERFGNPASRNHAFGWAASEATEKARAQVAASIGAHSRDVLFTSGATESNNIALQGVARAYRAKGAHIVTVVTEHPSIVQTCRYLEGEGCQVTYLPVGPEGLLALDRLEAALTPQTVLVSVMMANNEIGVIQPIAAIAEIAHAHGALFHTDASQAVGKVPVDVEAAHVDLASCTAHKMYGPKGVGMLYVRRKRVDLPPLMFGGGQESGLRSGTLNVPAIVGFGKAAEIAASEMEAEGHRLRGLRDRLLAGLRARLAGMHVNGALEPRLPHNLNVSFEGIESESLAMALTDIAVSSGSACGTGKSAPSRVLKALGLDDELAMASMRFGLGRWTTADEVDYVIEKVAAVIEGLRRLRHALEA
jgi:cysteine desulfurase